MHTEPLTPDCTENTKHPDQKPVEHLLELAGIPLNGHQKYSIQINDPRFYQRVISEGSLGLGESYMDGWWDCQSIDELITRLLHANIDKIVHKNPVTGGTGCVPRLFNLQTLRRATQVAEAHYDLGNDLFTAMLDKNLCYSCAYWKDATTLDQAQENKLDLLCRKLDLQPGERVLDIGCGWGSFAHYAASHYHVHVTGITVSAEQQKLAQERCHGLPVIIELEDYRKLQGQFDKVVSIGMFEHVGIRNYPTYFATVRRVLKPGGLFALHTIGSDRSRGYTDPWIEKYIFPNGVLPSLAQIACNSETNFLVDDVQNFGPDYDHTLMVWKQRFEKAWPELREHYDERFRRMWLYYLQACAGSFRSGQLQLYQIILRHRNQARPRYDAPR